MRTSARVRLLGAALLLVVIGAGAVLLMTNRDRPEARGASVNLSDLAMTDDLPTHERFSRLLERAVHMPLVDYELVQRERQELDGYVERLAATRPAALEEAPRDAALAFWINAYNACMLKLVVDHYPIEPGRVGLFGAVRNRVAGYPENSVWQIPDVFTRSHCPVAGELRSQDEIEHEIIRPRFDEPRIHFAVNCAARSCPVLWPDAYTADDLEAQLERAVDHFMASPEHFGIDPGPPPTLRLNKVLDWYREDFGGIDGLVAFFLPRVGEPEAGALSRPDLRVEFEDYDWTLNDLPR